MKGHASIVERRRRESVGARVRRRRRELGLTQVELARLAGINQGYLSSIERDRAHPRQMTLDALAGALDLPQGVLLGAGAAHDAPQPLERAVLPMFGSVPAGPPSESQERVDAFPVLRHQWSPDHYCLRLSLDSMEPTLKPGDIVIVHYRPDVQAEHVQGRICACLVDGEPTLKRVSVEREGGEDRIVLRGDNPAYEPIRIDGSRRLSLQGVVIRLASRDL